MINKVFNRTISLIGEQEFSNIHHKKVYLAGLGGVGGTVFEALFRSGIVDFTIIDKDKVDFSNLNRQILYTLDDVGRPKALVAAEKAGLVCPEDLDVKAYQEDVRTIMPKRDMDIIIDCIDNVEAKITLIEFAVNNHIPIICSMGMANKIDPTRIKIGPLNKSTVDPLAKKMRYELKKRNIDYTNVVCVYSDEEPIKDGAKLNSIVTVTSTAGLYIASYVLNLLKIQ